jgi:hypothetical protein
MRKSAHDSVPYEGSHDRVVQSAWVARLLGRDRSTTSRWLSGARPMPAWAAIRLRELASYLASRMTDAAIELKLKRTRAF